MSMISSFFQKIKPGIKPLPEGLPFKNVNALIATWFGAGLLRPAPGTIGSLAAIPFGYGIAYLWGIPGMLLSVTLVMVLGTMASNVYGKKSGEKDNQSIVVDEVVGLWIAAIPAGTDTNLWLVAFILFRLFDIYKPWPASYFDNRGKNGFDVMMDDVIAGFYAMLGVATGALAINL